MLSNNQAYESNSGSKYMYTDEGVYRFSNHWNGGVASCSWFLDNKNVDTIEYQLGFCKWEDFMPNDMSITIYSPSKNLVEKYATLKGIDSSNNYYGELKDYWKYIKSNKNNWYIEVEDEKIYNPLIYNYNFITLNENKPTSKRQGSNDDVRSMRTSSNNAQQKDNQGNVLSAKMINYLNSDGKNKALTDGGKVPVVYHTMTQLGKQFNEFDPRKDSHYRFHNQIVNYYTDSQDMSGSYADSGYQKANTKRISSVDQLKKELGDSYKINKNLDGSYTINYEDKTEKKIYNYINEHKEDMLKLIDFYRNITNPNEKRFFEDEVSDKSTELQATYLNYIDFLKDNISDKEILRDKRIGHSYSREAMERALDVTSKRPRKLTYNFKNQTDMFKNAISETQGKQNYMYSGYVKITNPYVVDAKGRYWNNIEEKYKPEQEEAFKVVENLDINTQRQIKDIWDKTIKPYNDLVDERSKILGIEDSELTSRQKEISRILRGIIIQDYEKHHKYFYPRISNVDLQYRNITAKDLSTSQKNDIYSIYSNSPVGLYELADKYIDKVVTANTPDERQKQIDKLEDDILQGKYPENNHEDYLKQFNQDRKTIYSKDGKTINDIAIDYLDINNKLDNMKSPHGTYINEFDNIMKNNKEYQNAIEKLNLPDTINPANIYSDALFVVNNTNSPYKEALDEQFKKYISADVMTTNDIVKEVIQHNIDLFHDELNHTAEEIRAKGGYDGVIIKNTVDYGGLSMKATKPANLYVTFSSNQFKAMDNKAPTSNPDIRYMKTSKTHKYNNYTKKEIENLNSPRIRIANSDKDVIKFAESAKKIPSNLKLYFGKVENDTANRIKNDLGIDINNYNISLKADTVRHIFSHHGDLETEHLRGQQEITDSDLLDIPNIVNDYDKVYIGKKTSGGNSTIIFEKNINGNDVVVTYTSDRHNDLNIKTMYKIKNKNRSISPASNTSNALDFTSETTSSIAPNTSITQSNNNVKKSIVPPNNNDGDILSELDRQRLIEKSKTNGEREGAYIEQAIQEVKKHGTWDDNIKPVGTTDIIDYINKYFGDKIEKGNFRQRAYAIYKPGRDIIRTKSYKDIDSIIHEVFHRIYNNYNIKDYQEEIYPEVVTNEVLDLYSDLDEAEVTDEGFAEMGRRYIVQKDYIEKNMPHTIAILEKIEKEDPKLKTFLDGLNQKVHDYIFESPWARTQGSVSYSPTQKEIDFKKSIKDSKNRLFINMLNQDYALEMATDFIGKGLGYINSYELDAKDNPVIQNALKDGIGEKIDSILQYGIYDLDTGKKLCDGISKIADILPNTEDQMNFSTYLVARRAVEANEKGKKTGIRYDDAKFTVEKYSRDPRMEEARKIYNNFNDTLLNEAVKAGLYSEEDVANMRENWQNYATFFRVMDDTNSQGGGSLKNPIKRFQGSERDIVNPLESTIIMLGKMYPAMQRNITMKSFADFGEFTHLGGVFYDIIPPKVKHIATEHLSDFKKALENQGIDTEGIDLNKTYELYYPDRRDDRKNRITSYRVNGKEVTLQFRDDDMSKELYNVFAGGYSKEVPNMAQKVLIETGKIFRYGTTIINPSFAINNMSSDTQQAGINAKGKFIPYSDTYKGLIDLFVVKGLNDLPKSIRDKIPKSVLDKVNNIAPERKEKLQQMYALFKQSGASGGTRTSLYTNRLNTSRKIADVLNSDYNQMGIKKNKFRDFIDTLSIPSSWSEEATRFEVFLKDMEEANKKNPGDFYNNLVDSAYNTRNATQNFSTGGKQIKKLSAYIPYLSAKIGSIENARILYKEKAGEMQKARREAIAKAIMEGKSNKEATKAGNQAAVKVCMKSIVVGAIGVATGILLTKLYKDNKEYDEINQQKKYNNFYVKVGDKWLKIKKAQGVQRLWINLGQYLADLTSGKLKGKSISSLFDVVGNAIEDTGVSDDWSAFIPPVFSTIVEIAANYDFYYKEKIVPEYMREQYEPKDWYNESTSWLSKQLGNTFNVAPMYIDYFVKNAFGTTFYNLWKQPDKMLSMTGQYPSQASTSGGAFTLNPYSSSQSVDEFYDRYNELKRKEGSGTITDEEKTEYDRISKARTTISNINKQIKDVKKDLTTSKSEKEKAITALQKIRTDTARQALGKDLIDSSNTSSIERNRFYPTRDTLKDNGNTLNLTSSMKNEYSRVAYNYYKENKNLYNADELEDLQKEAKDYAKNYILQKYENQLTETK